MKRKILTTAAAATLTLGLGATAPAPRGRPPALAKAASPTVWPVSRPVSARCNRLVSCRLLPGAASRSRTSASWRSRPCCRCTDPIPSSSRPVG
jgi:hypothetical protein